MKSQAWQDLVHIYIYGVHNLQDIDEEKDGDFSFDDKKGSGTYEILVSSPFMEPRAMLDAETLFCSWSLFRT